MIRTLIRTLVLLIIVMLMCIDLDAATFGKSETIFENLKTQKNHLLVITKANILHRVGKLKSVRTLLIELYRDDEYFNTLSENQKGVAYNSIAWAMVELDMVDNTTVEIANKALIFSQTGQVMDTLACVYARLGNFQAAIGIEQTAVERTGSDWQKKEFLKKIKEWEQELKGD